MVQLRGALRKRFLDKEERIKREKAQLVKLTAKASFAKREHAIKRDIAEQHARLEKFKGKSKRAKAFEFGFKLGKEILKERQKRKMAMKRKKKR